MAINLTYPGINPPQETAPEPQEEAVNPWDTYKQEIEAYNSEQLSTEITKYFFDRSFLKGQFKNGPGGMYWDKGLHANAPVIPGQDEAWMDYQQMLSKYNIKMRAEHFDDFQQRYSAMTQRYNNQLQGKSQQLVAMGYDEEDIRRIYAETPELLAGANVMMNDPVSGAQNSVTYAPYMPKAEGDLSRFMRQNSGKMALGGMGAAVGVPMATDYLRNAPADIVEDAQSAFKRSVEVPKAITDNLSDAKKMVKDLSGKRPSNIPLKQWNADKKAAKELLKEATKKYRAASGSRTARKVYKDTVKDNQRWRKLLGGGSKGFASNLTRGASFFGMPYAVEALAEGMTGDEKVGDVAGKSAQAAVGLQPILGGLTTAWKKHGATKVMKEILKKGGLGLAARTVGKVGAGAVGGVFSGGVVTGLMAAWSMKDIYEVYKIIQDMD